MIQDVPGMTPLRELRLVGRGLLADLLEDAGYRTVADLREETRDQVTISCEFIRNVQAAVDRARDRDETRDWGRVARKAYHVMLAVREADVSDATHVPDPFRCPLSLDWMADPVVTPRGHSYDREHIARWLEAAGTDPFTREPLSVDRLVPNLALARAIALYRPLEERFLVPHG